MHAAPHAATTPAIDAAPRLDDLALRRIADDHAVRVMDRMQDVLQRSRNLDDPKQVAASLRAAAIIARLSINLRSPSRIRAAAGAAVPQTPATPPNVAPTPQWPATVRSPERPAPPRLQPPSAIRPQDPGPQAPLSVIKNQNPGLPSHRPTVSPSQLPTPATFSPSSLIAHRSSLPATPPTPTSPSALSANSAVNSLPPSTSPASPSSLIAVAAATSSLPETPPTAAAHPCPTHCAESAVQAQLHALRANDHPEPLSGVGTVHAFTAADDLARPVLWATFIADFLKRLAHVLLGFTAFRTRPVSFAHARGRDLPRATIRADLEFPGDRRAAVVFELTQHTIPGSRPVWLNRSIEVTDSS